MKPDYTGYCLSNVPSTVMSLLGVDPERPKLPDDALGGVETAGVENVVLILCDGLGFAQFRRHGEGSFFGGLTRKGSVRPMTTVFPSTTAAALTTVSTGLTPQEHGLPEWFVYMEEIGEVIVTLPFTRVGDYGRDTLEPVLSAKALFDGKTVFQRLKTGGVDCMSFTNRTLANTAYSLVTRAGSEVTPYASSSDLSVSLRHFVETAKGRNFIYVYWSMVDTIEHIYGPNGDESGVEASIISHALQEGFLERLDKEAAKNTLILLTADHGQLQVEPERTLYMNRFMKLARNLQRNSQKKRIPPWGSARDSYLLVDEGKLDEVKEYLQRKLEGTATVLKPEEAVAEGLFGINSPSKKFRRRVGNLMILPHDNKTVWYRYKKGEALDLRGHHGGLTKDEITIPLAAARASDLQR